MIVDLSVVMLLVLYSIIGLVATVFVLLAIGVGVEYLLRRWK